MKIAFINGSFMPLEEVRISPLDRGFLFGEGIYEVIPCYEGKMIAWSLHMQRLWQGLKALDIVTDFDEAQLHSWCQGLVERNIADPLNASGQGIYVQVTRGAEEKRFHGWKNSAPATLFMMSNPIPNIVEADINNVNALQVNAEFDRRWRNCHIKSTSLLGNVLHFQHAQEAGKNEVLLMDENNFVTEASTSNVFILKNGQVKTPPLSNALLPGVTRSLMLAILREYSNLEVVEAKVSYEELLAADEVWLTSSTKGIVPVVKVNDIIIANGLPGEGWLSAARLYLKHKFDF